MSGAADKTFRAMGTDCQILVTGPNARRLATLGMRRVDDLEQLWSRFLPESEISQLNRTSGRPKSVSGPTFELIRNAISAWHLSEGLFDPTMHEQINGLGYNQPFETIGSEIRETNYRSVPGAGCEGIVLDADRMTIKLPKGLKIDPGGIGKGFAADVISEELMYAGADGVLVSLGGDLRVRGESPTSEGWVIRVRDPKSAEETQATVVLEDAALATSSTLTRTWNTGAGHQHHLLDPRTGLPSASEVISATAIAGEGWWAEAAAKTAVLSETCSQTAIPNVAILRVLSDHSEHRMGDFESYES